LFFFLISKFLSRGFLFGAGKMARGSE
jgi:hypothetical protein